MKIRRALTAGVLLALIPACSASPASEDTAPTQPVAEPAAAPAEPEAPAAPAEPQTQAPAEEPPAAKSAAERYRGRTIVVTEVERNQIRCTGTAEAASYAENRQKCVDELAGQVSDPNAVVLVIDEMRGNPCSTCVSMMAEVSTAANDPPGRVLIAKERAGTVECNAGDAKKDLGQTRTECYQTLQKQGASIRAAVILPDAIEEGEPCKSCISIVGTGWTAEFLP